MADFAALVLIVPAPTVGVWAAMVAFPDTVLGKGIFFVCKAWMLALPVFWRIVVDRKFLSLSRPRRGGLGAGAVLGVVIGAVIVLAYWMLGSRWIDGEHVRAMAVRNGIGAPGMFIAAGVYWVTVNALLEEYVYRWFIFRKWERFMAGPAAVVAAAVCFTIHHVIALKVQFGWNATVLASLGVFIGGAAWSWLYLRYRSIWPGYVSHAIVDVAVFVIGWRIIFGGG